MSQSRRNFLGALPGLAAAPISWAAFAQAARSAPVAKEGQEQFWQLVRQQFQLEPGLVYLNAANICPASRLVMDRYLHLLRDFHSNPSFQNRDKYKPLQEQIRSKLAAMLAAKSDEIAITRNTSEGTNMIVAGLDLQRGDEIIITDHNHPSNNDAWKVRARRHGLEVKVVPVTIPARSKQDLIDGFEKAITPRTKVVAFTHLTSTTGILYPAREITEIAHRRGAWVHLDGAQTFGLLRVNLRDIGCDSYSGSAHKWMMGPLEAGVLFVRGERIGNVWPSVVTAGWSEDLKGARKLENLGQRDDPRVAALEPAIDFYNLVGAERIENRTQQLAASLKQGLAKLPNLRLKTNMESSLSSGVVKFQLKNKDTKACYDRIWERHRIAMAITPSGDSEGLRFSPHIYNNEEDVERAIAAVREIAAG
ncbi:MAG TPA: aminotransferase class V-fold PLP-dependent enzyme [Bryobacteraceae bacterium]|nr:aminotransferase class V-fold PLP-dependent enzyme [Bryobacteraceae bacterium]